MTPEKRKEFSLDALRTDGWFERIEQSYYQALDAFIEAITKGIPPRPSLEDGLKAQLLADKATESLKSGQPVKFAK